MKKCNCYHIKQEKRYMYDRYTGAPISHIVDKGVCFGTKEQDECSCGGDRIKCSFYPEIREKAKEDD